MTRFHGPDLAKGWLAAGLASGTDKAVPVLHRTIMLEDYPTGIRVLATDRFVLLTAWIPADGTTGREPGLDEAPVRTVVASDADGRGKSLLGYVLTRWNRLESAEREFQADEFAIELTFDVRMPAGTEPQGTLEGLDPTYLVLDMRDVERVWLQVIDAPAINWRSIVAGHVAESTKTVHLNPDRLGTLGKLTRYTDGPLEWTFMGAEKAALIDLPMSDPHVQGIVMPSRLVTEQDPAPTDEEPPADEPPWTSASGDLSTDDIDALHHELQAGETLLDARAGAVTPLPDVDPMETAEPGGPIVVDPPF